MKKKINITADPLRVLYNEYHDKLAEKGELENNDLTDVLFYFFEDKLKHGELINVTVRGEVAIGKSTVAILLMWYISKLLKNTEFRIFSDQTEFLRFIKSDEMNICIVIDEYNQLAEGGINATTEKDLFDFFSDVAAQRYIHRINCAPATVMDKNSLVVLDVLGSDKNARVTRCILKYRDPTSMDLLTLGYADIDVSPVLETDFYKRYRKKKFNRMDLVRKRGVRDIRFPEFARFVLKTYAELKDNTEFSRVPVNLIAHTGESAVMDEGLIYSELAKMHITSRTQVLLDLDYEANKILKQMIRAKAKKDMNKFKEIGKVLQKLNKLKDKRLKWEKGMAKLYKDYLAIK